MASISVTYRDIECVLAELGFDRLQSTGDHRAFRHEESDTLIVLPGWPADNELDAIHRAVVRRMLDERGVIDGDAFDSLLAQRVATPTA